MTFGRVHSGIIPGPRTEAPPSPQRGTRQHGTQPKPDERWDLRAACVGLPAPLNGGQGSVWIEPGRHPRHVVEAALRVCASCPVREQCDRDAEEAGKGMRGDVLGIWGGRSRSFAAKAKKLRDCRICGRSFTTDTNRDICSAGCYRDEGVRVRSIVRASPDSPPEPLLAFFGDLPAVEIARRCGVSSRTVSRWKLGQYVQSPAWIASNIGVTTFDIWGMAL